MKIVDKNLNIPLHTQLSLIIRDMIEGGELKEGNYLMPEREICKIQNVSRMTVNKAILNLVSEGLLDRKQGKGTFVAYKKKKHKFQKLLGFTEVMNEKGFTVKSKLLKFELDSQNKSIREKLNVEDKDTLIYKIERIRYIDEDPFALEIVYILQDMCEDLSEDLVRENSLYTLYRERYNHKTKRAEQVISPIMINEFTAELLNQESNTLALKIDRLVYTDKEEIMEYTSSIFMTGKHEYEIVLHED
ncbi:GntR family transcriptional regulator [Clostridium botulinum]|uniref:GntR family transcriptional regulator n=1 Tax=Clostridium botulinum TaxID=1491 RepID=A0A6B4FK45_CLOBO|nr:MULTISPECIES: GntR family transcriptional regulator [Clostridium]ACD53596.1 GntR-family transcriptional regulator [Clostridium botulinum E3 str. Alaska E43]AJF28708.1 GntR family transcriptional regulator [Clostridium botulinum]AJF31769.1 GntR family transcriptional regulator [Clostridium botulinum]EES47833.1 GntR-family transcriptional regulator [Clostridium botulinum E1 str. 'BoNT E Beluga']KIL08924.1 GntR family transcriptional regulator [Clostridium botulinum]